MLVLIVCIIFWYATCAISDTISTVALGSSSPLIVTFYNSLFGALTGYIVCYTFVSEPPQSPGRAPVTRATAPIAMTARLIQEFPNKLSPPSSLLLLTGVINALALWMMFSAFGHGGMAIAYAFKATEPLVTCVLCTATFLTAIGGCVSLMSAVGTTELSWKAPAPTWRVWLWVSVVCGGAIAMSGSITKKAEGGGAAQQVSMPLLAITFIFLSNTMFALRTTVSKPLLHHQIEEGGGISAAAFFFVNIGLVSSAVTLLPTVYSFFNKVDLTWGQHLGLAVSGACYYVFQLCGNFVLLRISCVSYAVARQMRVVVVFATSVFYFGNSFSNLYTAVGGGCAVIGGSVMYAWSQQAAVPKSEAI